MIYPTNTPSLTPTRQILVNPTVTQTPAPFFSIRNNQIKAGILASIGLVWVLLAIWIVLLLRRASK
jgi:hypothetical protein